MIVTRRRTLPAVLLALGVTGCVTYGGARVLDVATDLNAPRGFTLTAPAAIETPAGTRFRGSICRRYGVAQAHTIRLERVGPSGDVIASASRALPSLAYRGQPCTFYEVATDWSIQPAERVRVCATQTDKACSTPP